MSSAPTGSADRPNELGSPSTPWYVAAFGPGYRDIYPHRDLDAARKEARWLSERGARGRVLDLCCGFGRHTLALAELGADAYGLDLSEALLSQARELPDARRLRGRLVRGDARALPFADESFDALVMLFSSFGYFDERGDRAVLAEISRVLRAGGSAIFDLMNPVHVRANLVAESRRTRAGATIVERRHLEDGARFVVKRVDVTSPDGERRGWSERVRLYGSGEFESLLARHALAPIAAYGDYDASAHTAASPRQIHVARKT